MSSKKSTQKVGPLRNNGGDISIKKDFTSSMSSILQIVKAAFIIPQDPVTPLPPPLIMIGGSLRTGMSSKQIASWVISRQSEAGAPVGDIWGDGENPMEGMISIMCKELVNSIQTEAKVDIVVPPGISLTGVGAGNFGAPVIIQGYTTNYKEANGIIR